MKLTPIIFIILAVGIFFIYVQPQNEELNRIKTIEKEYTSAQSSANDLRKKRERLQEEFKKIGSEDQNNLKLMLPDTVDNVRLLNDITALAARDDFDITLSNISISSGGGDDNEGKIIIDDSKDGYGTIKVSFSFVSTYETYKQFLRALELSLRLMDIKSLTVRTSEGPLSSYSVVFDTYWLR